MTKEIILSIITGIVSAVIYSLLQRTYQYFQWSKTKSSFVQKIRTLMLGVQYNLVNILDINVIYPTDYEDDHLMTHEELISVIKSYDIDEYQYKEINKAIDRIRLAIEEARREALAVPIFTPSDFHSVDKLINSMASFNSFYYWCENEVKKQNMVKSLKRYLIDILNYADQPPFSKNIFDRIYVWCKRRKLNKILKIN